MANKPKSGNRIEVLDSFRFFAILSVILYHFYSRWTPPRSEINLYPYGGSLNYFNYGYLGVEFFFVISGFVIAFTLQKTSRFSDFLKKRFIRLFPAMLICSLITFTIFLLHDKENLFPRSHELKNLGFSLTFLGPDLINKFSAPHGLYLTYINGSYWSLWPEIQFYLLASIIYYLNPKKFFISFFIISVFLFTLNFISHNLHDTNTAKGLADGFFIKKYTTFTELFSLNQFILWFLMGVLFFQIHSKKSVQWALKGLLVVVLLQVYDSERWQIGLSVLIVTGVFLIFLYFPDRLKFLRNKIFVAIGAASYSLYLIHENIGVLLINKYADSFGRLSFLFPIVIIILLISFSVLFYKRVEISLGKYLKQKFLTKKFN